MVDIAQQVRQIVATSFHVDEAVLSDTTGARDVDGWDSLAHATLILRLQRVFKVRLDPAKANSAQNLGQLTTLIENTIANA